MLAELVTDVNLYEILGYFRFEDNLQESLKAFATHISKIIIHTEELQKDDAYMGIDVSGRVINSIQYIIQKIEKIYQASRLHTRT